MPVRLKIGAEGGTRAIYGRPVPIQLVWFSHAYFHANTRYINHITTRALLDGVVMSSHPENYRSRYANNLNESEYEYMW